jgi:hypothetical protein
VELLMSKFKRSTRKLRFRLIDLDYVVYVGIYNFSYVDLIN